jgi:formylmethanofuran dehydrogenase subunit B
LGKAWINGTEVPEGDAVVEAARLIAESRLPLVTGLGTDVAGVKAALALARHAGGVIDHAASDVLYRNVEVLRSAGMFVAAPAEMRRRADRFLVVGAEVATLSPELLAFVLGGEGMSDGETGSPARRLVWLGGPAGETLSTNQIATETIACAGQDLPQAVAMVRAALAGRRFGAGPIEAEAAAGVAATLAEARFACVIWSAASLDALGVEMLSGLVADLNLTTRASSLPLGGAGQAFGAAQVATAVSGYPLRSRFVDGIALHDPWACDGRRLIASGESDLVVHVDALVGSSAPVDAGGLPVIAIAGPGATFAQTPAIVFEVGLAGRDHAGALYDDIAATFVPVDVVSPGGPADSAPGSAAKILAAITAALAKAPAKRAA